MRSLLLLGLGLSLVACGGTVTHGDLGGGPADGAGGEPAGGAPVANGGSDPGWNEGASPPFSCDDDFEEPTACDLVPPVVVTPSDLSPTDGCEATYTCNAGTMVVTCDGENDGTNTSLCSCHLNGQSRYGGLVGGEGVDACLNGLLNCTDPSCAE